MPSPTTAIQIISKAMRHLNVLAVGEVPSAAEIADGIDALNDVLETWNTEQLNLYMSLPETFATIAGRNSYTVGPAGDFNTTRPLQVDNVYITYSGVNFPIMPWTLAEYMAVSIPGLQQPIPQRYVYLNDNPLGRFLLYPTPSQAVPIVLDIPTLLTGAADQTTVFSLPPAYARALQYAVAVEMQSQYGGADVSAYAKASMSKIKRANRGPSILKFDSALTGRGGFLPVRGW